MQPLSRRRFIGRLARTAGVAGALALDPAALRRAAAAAATPSAGAAARAPLPAVAGGDASHLAWVWQFSHDGSKEEIARVLAPHGLGVVMKTHDGIEWMSKYDRSRDGVSGPEQVAALARFFEDAGVPFHAWSVVKGLDPAREAEMAASVLAAGARSIALDLEAHSGFWRGTPASASAFGQALRRQQPNAWVVTSIDARPWEVDRIPMRQFAEFTNEIAPQVYWSAFQTAANVTKFKLAGYPPGADGVTPRFALEAAIDKLRPFGLPVRPVGDGQRSVPSEWNDFIEHAYTNAAEAVSVWRYGVTAASVWQLLQGYPPRAVSYVVQAGDSLGALAARWGTDVASIVELNGIANQSLIAAGTRLRVPRAGTAAAPASHTVQPGETLSAIANRYGVTPEAIAQANGIANPNLLHAGQELQLPRGGATRVAPLPQPVSYAVQPGDNLHLIADRYGSTPDAIAQANGLANPNLLRAGQQLMVPVGGAARAAPQPLTYTVQRGDALYLIAARFGTTVEALVRLNGLARPDLLTAGMELRVR